MRRRPTRGGHLAGVLAALAAAGLGAAAALAEAPADGPIPAPPARTIVRADAPATATAPADVTASAAPVPGAKAHAPPSEPSAVDPFALPPDFRTADGAIDQDALVAQERRRLDLMNEKLKGRFRISETVHYLIFSDVDPSLSASFGQWCEALYGNLCTEFGIDPKGRVWDGKCMLAVFAARQKFEAYARCFDGEDVRDAGAYFSCESFGGDGPNLVHICIPADDRTPKRLQELLAHEGTHAFFQLYRRPVTLPLWLHEGLAEYMTVVNDPTLGPRKSLPAKRAARLPAGLDSLFSRTADKQLSLTEYSIAYSLVAFLQKTGHPKFMQMIDLLKEGKDAEAAMKEAYGFGTAGLEERWRASVTGAAK